LALFHDTTPSYAGGIATGEVYFNKNQIVGWNQYGDNAWRVRVKVWINGVAQEAWATASCTNAGWAYPATKTYTNVQFSYGDMKSNGTADFTGDISSGATGGQGLRLTFTMPVADFYQPVATSNAQQTTIGQPLKDTITVLEANKNGNRVTSNFQWRKNGNNYAGINVCADVYGPFITEPERVPDLTLKDAFFGVESFTPAAPSFDTSVTIIGDGVTQAATSAIAAKLPGALLRTQSDLGFYDEVAGTVSSGIDFINGLPNAEIRNYVVYALGTNDVSQGTVHVADVIAYVDDVKDAIEAKNSNAKVIFMMVYDGNLALDGWSYWEQQTPPEPEPTGPKDINEAVKAFNRKIGRTAADAAADPANPIYINWYEAVSQNGNLVESDGITPTAAGQTVLADLIYDAVQNAQPALTTTTTYQGARWGVGGDQNQGSPAGAYRSDLSLDKYRGYQCYSTGDKAAAPGASDWTSTLTFSNMTGNPNGITNSSNFPAGKYYFVTHLTRGGSDPMVLFANWFAPFAESSEKATVKFQPYVTSSVKQESRYFNGDSVDVVDEITSYVATTLDDANNDKSIDNKYWQNIPVRVCVAMYGPYQQERKQDHSAPTYDAGDLNLAKNICSGTGDVGAPGNFMGAGEIKEFNFGTTDRNGDSYQPGYYYFVSRIETGQQSAGVSDLMIDNWTSKLNPSGEDEWAVRQFQPIVTSDVQGNCPPCPLSHLPQCLTPSSMDCRAPCGHSQ
jgi:hypothetical protein